MLKTPFLLIIRAYQLIISPVLGPSCRYYPTCSQYTHDAIKEHGILRGVWLGSKRILSCHPWSAGGVDPVPEKLPKNKKTHKNCIHQQTTKKAHKNG